MRKQALLVELEANSTPRYNRNRVFVILCSTRCGEIVINW